MEDIEPMITTKELRDMAAVNQYIAFTLKKDQHKKLLDTLPADLRKKLQALRKLQADTVKLDAEFHQEIYNIERVFLEKYSTIFEKRRDIIVGDHCPTDEECTCTIPGLEGTASEAAPPPVDGINAQLKGIPNFWLNTFKYAPLLDTMVKEADEPVLKYLEDVRVTSKPAPDMSFTLHFYFAPNDYFTDSMLTKEYFMKCTPDPEHPFSFDGPEIYNAVGCPINWQPDKNVTMKLISSGKEVVPKLIKIDSFFNFFDTIVVPEDTADEKYDKLTEYLQYDFEIGHYIKEKIVPKAVLYFTGEADDDIDDSEISTVSNDDEPAAAGAGIYPIALLKKEQHINLLDSLPTDLRNKMQALRKLQVDVIKLDVELHQEKYNIGRAYMDKNSPIYEKRRDIIVGDHIPTDEECSCTIPGFEVDAVINVENVEQKGIPNFWLNTFKYAPVLDTMVQEGDEQLLKYLKDVRATLKPLPDMSFTLEFYFEPNDYFTDTMLTKEYLLKCSPESDDPFSFDGLEIYKAVGCSINWQPDKNLTIKSITSGTEATPKSIKIGSFFNFFDTVDMPEDISFDHYDKLEEDLLYDFEIGHYIKQRIVPRAVLYFTGEANDDIDDLEISVDSNIDVYEQIELDSEVINVHRH